MAIGTWALVSGCSGLGSGSGRPGNAAGSEIVVVPPHDPGWKEVETATGRFFVKAVDGMADVVSLFVISSKPGANGVASLDELESLLRLEPSGSVGERWRDEVHGVPVLRYTSVRKSEGDAGGTFQQALGLPPRPASYRYLTRETGALFLHPGRPGHVVRAGCARTSYHGLLGTYFEAEAQAFVDQVVLENSPNLGS